ncbi:hypothetical protein [Stenotrophomonas maltophilia]|uniref:hypothetical protein n=1 Tax=Stenotrophomonas maltophilia TaxID=40324 RepID=UPI0011B439C2|nr:hypothetical protein [Stenotrophomonas maltophilia]
MSRSTFSCTPKAREGGAIRRQIHEFSQNCIPYGYESMLVMLRRDSWLDKHKGAHRNYKETD